MAPTHVRTAPHKLKKIVPTLSFSKHPSDQELIQARVFFEPLAPMSGARISGENEALAKALLSFKKTDDRENVTALTGFVSAYPHSRWRPSLELNIGLLRQSSGYVSDAMKLFRSAWQGAKGETGPRQVAVANRAMAKLLFVNARLGRDSQLRQDFAAIGKRSFFGSDQRMVRDAHEGLWLMDAHPERAFKCGPFAVDSILNIKRATPVRSETIKKASSTKNGTNLAQVKELADKVGLKFQFAKRTVGSPLIVPAIMHWKLGHFAAITGPSHNLYTIKDPTFDTDGTLAMSKQALDKETDGFFLVPAGPLPAGWQTLSEAEAKTVWGRGSTTSRNGNEMGGSPCGPAWQ